MIEIPIGWLVSLCIMAFIGIIFSLFIIYFSFIEPLKDMITNYKKYKEFYESKQYEKWDNYFKELNQETSLKECSNCKKQHTMDCPNSAECYATEDKPYFENKEIEVEEDV